MHGVILVAIDTARRDRAMVESKVLIQMGLFGGSPEHGGLWDSWEIGGRWTGHLSGYDPFRDQRNYSLCNHCGGTGTRELTETDTFVRTPEEHEAWYAHYSRGHQSGLFPVIGKGCDACMGTGLMRDWPFVPHDGDIMRRDEIDLAALLRRQRADAVELYRGMGRDPTLCPRAEREGILAMTEAEYVATVPAFPPFDAFLRDRHLIQRDPWDRPEETVTDSAFGACTFTALAEDADDWHRQFYKRFVEPLPGSTLLVVIDYHH